MYDKRILSQLIAFTQEIRLIKPENIQSYEAQFLAGNESPFIFSGGKVIKWWHTGRGFELCNNIASMSIEKYTQLAEGDKNKLSEVIKGSFGAICTNDEYFDGDDVFLRRKRSLFEARTIDDVSAFSKKLWDFILSEMVNSIGDWCLAYPLPRLITDTIKIPDENIYLLKRTDKKSWKDFELEYPVTKYWDPSTGLFADGKPTAFSRLKYESLLVCLCDGTSDSGKFNAKLKFKIFLSILFALFRILKNHQLTKSSAQPYRICIQFKGKDNQSSEATIFSELGTLLPYYIYDFELKTDTTEVLEEWYNTLQHLEIGIKNRVKKAAHFINNAMVSDGINAFIHYFISLDALFGKRGDVERLILEGVETFASDPLWVQKTKWLYDLRSELVHGGARYEREWKDFERYVNHFKTHPLTDVMDLALLCILKRVLPNLTCQFR